MNVLVTQVQDQSAEVKGVPRQLSKQLVKTLGDGLPSFENTPQEPADVATYADAVTLMAVGKCPCSGQPLLSTA